MNITILGRGETARNLAEALCCPLNAKALVAVRFGSLAESDCTYEINNVSAIKVAGHKFRSLQAFREWGLPAPKFSLNIHDLNLPVLGRKFYHSQGRDIIYINTYGSATADSEYFIEFLKVEDEYRYHVIGSAVLATIKYGGNPNSICRNLRNGWKFRNIEKDVELEKLAIGATRSLGLDFGAVDIIISSGKPYLLEVNTAPRLSPLRIKFYAKEITRLYQQYFNKKEE